MAPVSKWPGCFIYTCLKLYCKRNKELKTQTSLNLSQQKTVSLTWQRHSQGLTSYVNLVISQKLSDAGIEPLAMNKPAPDLENKLMKIAAGREDRQFLKLRNYSRLEETLQWIAAEKKH